MQCQQGRWEGQCSPATLPKTQVPGQVPLPQFLLSPALWDPIDPSAVPSRTISPAQPSPALLLSCAPQGPSLCPCSHPLPALPRLQLSQTRTGAEAGHSQAVQAPPGGSGAEKS